MLSNFRIEHLFVCIANYVQDNVVISMIYMMLMLIPLGCMDVDLYIPHPLLVTYPYACMAIVCPGITVVFAYRYDLYRLAICRELRIASPQTMFPYIVQ